MAVAVMGKMIRLDKFLVEMDRGSRSQIKEAAKKGRILVNGKAKKRLTSRLTQIRIRLHSTVRRWHIVSLNIICFISRRAWFLLPRTNATKRWST